MTVKVPFDIINKLSIERYGKEIENVAWQSVWQVLLFQSWPIFGPAIRIRKSLKLIKKVVDKADNAWYYIRVAAENSNELKLDNWTVKQNLELIH